MASIGREVCLGLCPAAEPSGRILGAIAGLNQHLGPVPLPLLPHNGPERGNGVTARGYMKQVLIPHTQNHFRQHVRHRRLPAGQGH